MTRKSILSLDVVASLLSNFWAIARYHALLRVLYMEDATFDILQLPEDGMNYSF